MCLFIPLSSEPVITSVIFKGSEAGAFSFCIHNNNAGSSLELDTKNGRPQRFVVIIVVMAVDSKK